MNPSYRSHALALLELPRALAEMSSIVSSIPLLSLLPAGDGHGVFVIPGLTASDTSTTLLRHFLDSKGYRSSGWNMGRNMGLDRSGGMSLLSKQFLAFEKQCAGKVSIIGWSLGGLHARKIARRHPKQVRQVICLGSPINHTGSPYSTDNSYTQTDNDTIKVPCTSIYSKSDGVVPWQMSLETQACQQDNIEIVASHIGLGVNPVIFYLLADRLAQRENNWQAFDADHWRHRLALASLNPLAATLQLSGLSR